MEVQRGRDEESRGETMRRGAIKIRQCRGKWVGSALRVGGRDRQVLAQTTQDDG